MTSTNLLNPNTSSSDSSDFDILHSTSFDERTKAIDAFKSGHPLNPKRQEPKLRILNETDGNITANEIYDYLGKQEKEGEINTNGTEDKKEFPGMPKGVVPPLYSMTKDKVVGTGAGSVIPNTFYQKSASTINDASIYFSDPNTRDLQALFPPENNKGNEKSLSDKLKEKVFNFLEKSEYSPTRFIGEGIKDSKSKAILNSGIAGAVTGALGGLGYNTFNNVLTEKPKRSMLKDILLGVLAGGTAGAGVGYIGRQDYENSRKYASAFFAPPDQHLNFILTQIMGDYNIDFSQKNQLVNYVSGLDQNTIDSLYRVVSTSIGSGAAYVIARYLLNMGKTASILSAILGGYLGYNSRLSNPSATGFRSFSYI